MKKILLGFAVSLITLTTNIGTSAQSQFSNVPPNPPQGYCEGTGNHVTYNTMPWSAEWHYLRTSEWISNDEATAAGCQLYPDTSPPTCQNADSMNQNTENTTCMFNHFPNLTKESDFIAVRKCQNGNCNSNDPIHIYDEGAANSTYPTYNFSLNNSLSAGDKIRVIVHLHNTAIEGQFPTADTKLHLNWNETQKTITSFVEFTTPNNTSYANPGVTTNSSSASVSLPNLGSNLKLVPSTLSQLNTTWNNGLVRSYSPSLINPNSGSYVYDENNKSITYDLGQHISSYPNRKYVYIDFDVVATAPSFSLEKTTSLQPNEVVLPGDTFTYTLTVNNTGTETLTNINVVDHLDQNLEFIGGSGVSYDINSHTVGFTIASLSPGTTISREFTVQVIASPNGNNFCNEFSTTATANGTTLPTQTSNEICHNITLPNPHFSVEKTVLSPSAGTIVQAGDQITYQIIVTNDGDTDLHNIVVQDTLDENLIFDSGDPGVTHSGSTPDIVTLNFASTNPLPPQTGATLQFVVHVIDPLPNGVTQVCNDLDSATALDSNNQNVVGATLGNICHNTTNPEPEYSITKTDSLGSGAVYTAGQSFNYIITVENTGTVDIDYIEATDVLENRLEWDATTNSQNNPDITYNSISRVVTIPFHNIPAGQSMTRTFAVKTIDTLNNCDPEICNTVNSEITNPPIAPQPSATLPTTKEAPKKDIIDTISDWGSNLWQSTKNIFKNLFTAIIGNQDIIENPAKNSTKAINPSELIPVAPLAPNDTTDQFCRPVFCDVQSITKTADPVNGSNIVAGDIITYSITITNPGSTTMTNVVATDDLDSNLVYDGSDFPEVTENPANSGHIILDFGDIDPVGSLNNSATLTFRAKVVATLANGAQTCNVAEYSYNGETHQSNEVCHNFSSGGSGGGGGSGETNVIVDVCGLSGNGGAMCTGQMIPSDWWDDCYPENSKPYCEQKWIDENGLQSCSNADDCVIEIPTPEPNCVVGFCTDNFGFTATINKTPEKTNVAVDENAPYIVDISLDNTSGVYDMTINELRVYDFSVPADSGWLWGHILDTSSTSDWKWNPAKNYFNYNKKQFMIKKGENKHISLKYAMNTALTIKDDTAQVKNVVFATMKYTVRVEDSNGTVYPRTGEIRLGNNMCEDNITIPELLGLAPGAQSTYGSTATVQIDRPFVQVRSGANLGIKKYNSNQNPFGGYGKNSEQRVELDENLFQDFVDEETPANLDSTDTFPINGKVFKTSADNSNVWVYKGSNNETITLPANLNLTEPATFIIKDANLEISQDFALKNKLAAFIVDGGDIIIDASVKNIQGIFIATDGEIKSSDKSDIQLVISGAIMGDATDLLQKRIYIGETKSDGTWDLQPSVKINYDVRLLDDTPPALEAFLGEGSVWGQDEY